METTRWSAESLLPTTATPCDANCSNAFNSARYWKIISIFQAPFCGYWRTSWRTPTCSTQPEKYNSLLWLEMSDEYYLLDYPDDGATLITAHTVKQGQRILPMVMRRLRRWITKHWFSLVQEKTEVDVVTKERMSIVLRRLMKQWFCRNRQWNISAFFTSPKYELTPSVGCSVRA